MGREVNHEWDDFALFEAADQPRAFGQVSQAGHGVQSDLLAFAAEHWGQSYVFLNLRFLMGFPIFD